MGLFDDILAGGRDYNDLIGTTEQQYGIPTGMLGRLIHQESRGNPSARSPKGALGIAQFMPATAAEMGVDPLDPTQAIPGAGRYLSTLVQKYGGNYNRALMAYNWGQGNVDQWLARGGNPALLPAETRDYANVIGGEGSDTVMGGGMFDDILDEPQQEAKPGSGLFDDILGTPSQQPAQAAPTETGLFADITGPQPAAGAAPETPSSSVAAAFWSGVETEQDAAAALAASLGALDKETAAALIAGRTFGPQYVDPAAVQTFSQEINEGEYWKASGTLLRNPWTIFSRVGAQGMGTSLLPLATGATGAVAGSAVPVVGTIAGGAVGLGIGSGLIDAGATLLEEMAKAGVKMDDPADVARALGNEALMSRAKETALAHGVAVGVFDAASGAIAGRIAQMFTPGLKRLVAGGAGELAAQAMLGGTGEAVGQVAAHGRITDPAAVALEAIGEVGPGAVESLAGLRLREARRGLPTGTAPAPSAVPPSPAGAPPPPSPGAIIGLAGPGGIQRVTIGEYLDDGTVVVRPDEGPEELIHLDELRRDLRPAPLPVKPSQVPPTGTPVSAEEMTQQWLGVDQAELEGRARPLHAQPVRTPVGQTPTSAPLIEGITEEPTPAQAEAGNYRKRHTKWAGLDISIETEAGQIRRSKPGAPVPWEVTMPAPYGYIRRTEGKDGDQVDVYLGPEGENGLIYVIDQIDPETRKFDEHKVMLGFGDPDAAAATYVRAFSDGKGPTRIGALTPMTVDGFKKWLAEGNTKKPIAYRRPADVGIAAQVPTIVSRLTKGPTDELQQVPHTTRTAESVLPEMSRRFDAAVAALSPNVAGTAVQRQLSELRRRIFEAGETPEAAVRAVWGGRFANAPSELQQAVNRGLALQTVPSVAPPIEGPAPIIPKRRRKPARRLLSLAQFVSSMGGVRDVGGDLRSQDLHLWHRGKPGMRPLINNETGKSAHDLATRATEEGYFGHVMKGDYLPIPDDHAFMEALRDDARTKGGSRFTEGDQAEIDARDHEKSAREEASEEGEALGVPRKAFEKISAYNDRLAEARHHRDILNRIADELGYEVEPGTTNAELEAELDQHLDQEGIANAVKRYEAAASQIAAGEPRSPKTPSKAVSQVTSPQAVSRGVRVLNFLRKASQDSSLPQKSRRKAALAASLQEKANQLRARLLGRVKPKSSAPPL